MHGTNGICALILFFLINAYIPPKNAAANKEKNNNLKFSDNPRKIPRHIKISPSPNPIPPLVINEYPNKVRPTTIPPTTDHML
jgi:hypothetical protein